MSRTRVMIAGISRSELCFLLLQIQDAAFINAEALFAQACNRADRRNPEQRCDIVFSSASDADAICAELRAALDTAGTTAWEPPAEVLRKRDSEEVGSCKPHDHCWHLGCILPSWTSTAESNRAGRVAGVDAGDTPRIQDRLRAHAIEPQLGALHERVSHRE